MCMSCLNGYIKDLENLKLLPKLEHRQVYVLKIKNNEFIFDVITDEELADYTLRKLESKFFDRKDSEDEEVLLCATNDVFGLAKVMLVFVIHAHTN